MIQALNVTFHMRDGAAPAEMEFEVGGSVDGLVAWLETMLENPFFSGPGARPNHHVSIRCDQVAWFHVQPSETVGAF